MERLTRRVDGKLVFPTELVGVTLAPDNEYIYTLLHRLAAYEDTGMEPVWLDVADGVWALVDTDDDCVWLDRGGSIDIFRLTGKAYRRPPEGEPDA